MRTFFADAPEKAVSALLSETASDLSKENLDHLDALIQHARKRVGMMSSLLLTLALKGTVVLLLGGSAAWLLRLSAASLRHGVWAATFAVLLVLPVLSWTLAF